MNFIMWLQRWYWNTAKRFSIKLHLPASTWHNLSIFLCFKWREQFSTLLKVFMLWWSQYLTPGFLINCHSTPNPQNYPFKSLLFSNYISTADCPAGKKRVNFFITSWNFGTSHLLKQTQQCCCSLRQRRVMLRNGDLPNMVKHKLRVMGTGWRGTWSSRTSTFLWYQKGTFWPYPEISLTVLW